MLKKIILLMTILMLFSGCGYFQISNNEASQVLVTMAAIETGCSVKELGLIELDRAFRNAYEYSQTGTIPQDAVDQLNEQLSKVFKERPTLGLQITNLAKLVKIDLNPNSEQSFDFSAIPPELFQAAANGYDSGYKVCKSGDETANLWINDLAEENRDYIIKNILGMKSYEP